MFAVVYGCLLRVAQISWVSRLIPFFTPTAIIWWFLVVRGWRRLRLPPYFGGFLHRSKSDSLLQRLQILEQYVPQIKQRPWMGKVAGRLCYYSGLVCLREGRLSAAEVFFRLAVEIARLNTARAVRYSRSLGATLFMKAKLTESHGAFRSAGLSRRSLLSLGASPNVRSLDGAWFVAIGHVCTIDFYVKKRLLGWSGPAERTAVTHDLSASPGKLVAYAFRKYGIDFVSNESFEEYYDRNKYPDDLPYACLGADARFAIVDSFWEYDFPDGAILGYTHAVAKIQKQWELEKRPPLLALDEAERLTLDSLLEQMGVPRGSWYVCLHVREAGFHLNWNLLYPAARDAVVEDYLPAIKAITDRGGWVIRMGDPSMKPLPPMDHVVDYVHSDVRCGIGDIVIAAGCKFFIGTNSGYATVPGIYGIPCVFSNWVPMALPLWFSQDLMIPKVFWDRSRQDYVGFEQIFSTSLGTTQNVHDFPKDIEVRDNTPEEITEVVLEMFDRVNGEAVYTAEDEQLQDSYFTLGLQYGSYKGSRIGRDFLTRYKDLLP